MIPRAILEQLSVSAEQAGILLRELQLESVNEATAFVREGYPLVVAGSDGTFTIDLVPEQGRRNVNDYVFDGVTLSRYFGPHHGPQSDMLFGSNGYEYAGYTYPSAAILAGEDVGFLHDPYAKYPVAIRMRLPASEQADLDRGSPANQWRSILGLPLQGSLSSQVTMYGNRYLVDKALALFGAASGVGAQTP